MEVSADNLGHLFSAMDDPGSLRQSCADVIFHVLASLRESKEALDVVRCDVGYFLFRVAYRKHSLLLTLKRPTVHASAYDYGCHCTRTLRPI